MGFLSPLLLFAFFFFFLQLMQFCFGQEFAENTQIAEHVA